MYGTELAARLSEGGPGLSAFILMQRIRPPPQRSVLVRQGAWTEEETLSELGIFGTFLRQGQKVRSKPVVGLVLLKWNGIMYSGLTAGGCQLTAITLLHGVLSFYAMQLCCNMLLTFVQQ